jgi:hypothetical protein
MQEHDNNKYNKYMHIYRPVIPTIAPNPIYYFIF